MQANGAPTGGGNAADQRRADLTAQHHGGDVERSLIGHTLAVAKHGLDAELGQQGRNLLATTVSDHEVRPGSRACGHVATKLIAQLRRL
ncbi:MAG: hypothetical protein IPL79_06435 [Myxococcales bacterium]|nr:hypothetical protein [Myxococcales bacterium]